MWPAEWINAIPAGSEDGGRNAIKTEKNNGIAPKISYIAVRLGPEGTTTPAVWNAVASDR